MPTSAEQRRSWTPSPAFPDESEWNAGRARGEKENQKLAEKEGNKSRQLLQLKARQSGVTVIDVWALSLIHWLNPSIYMQKRCLMQIGPIRQDKTVLSGSYGNKSTPTDTGEAQWVWWAGGDLTLWCSKLGDYTLTAPRRLVLLQRPNCSAILSLLGEDHSEEGLDSGSHQQLS